jgi:hypothetical protein
LNNYYGLNAAYFGVLKLFVSEILQQQGVEEDIKFLCTHNFKTPVAAGKNFYYDL